MRTVFWWSCPECSASRTLRFKFQPELTELEAIVVKSHRVKSPHCDVVGNVTHLISSAYDRSLKYRFKLIFSDWLRKNSLKVRDSILVTHCFNEK